MSDGGVGVDREGAKVNAADKDTASIFRHADTGQGTASNLVGREDSAAVESHRLGDVYLDDTEICLDECVVNIHTSGQVLESTTQHRVELAIDSSEV